MRQRQRFVNISFLSSRVRCSACLVELRLSAARDLEAHHSDKQLEDKAFSLLKSLREQPTSAGEAATETVSTLKSYAAGLEEHLEKEERALVSRWLNLNPDLYAKYRTYLTGKYRLVY